MERDDDLRDVVASSYKNESSTVDSVRTRPSSSVDDVDGRDTGGRQPGPLVCSVLRCAPLRSVSAMVLNAKHDDGEDGGSEGGGGGDDGGGRTSRQPRGGPQAPP